MSDNSTRTLAVNVEAARRARGWTQKDLAVAVGTTREVVANLASGRMQSVSLELAVNLAAAFGVPLGDLIGEGSDTDQAAQRKLDAIRLIVGA